MTKTHWIAVCDVCRHMPVFHTQEGKDRFEAEHKQRHDAEYAAAMNEGAE